MWVISDSIVNDSNNLEAYGNMRKDDVYVQMVPIQIDLCSKSRSVNFKKSL